MLGKNLKKWAKCRLGHFVLFGQIVALGIKSLGKMSSWANCHLGHFVFGQNVTLGILSLGILSFNLLTFKSEWCHALLIG